jgi:hypothetical protein
MPRAVACPLRANAYMVPVTYTSSTATISSVRNNDFFANQEELES